MNRLRNESSWTIKRIADCFKVSERTIYRRIKGDQQKAGRKLKLDDETLEALLNYISERKEYSHPTKRVSELCFPTNRTENN